MYQLQLLYFWEMQRHPASLRSVMFAALAMQLSVEPARVENFNLCREVTKRFVLQSSENVILLKKATLMRIANAAVI